MKTFSAIVIILAIVTGLYKTHLAMPYAGPLLWGLTLWSICAVIHKVEKYRCKAAAAKRHEPIFVVALDPKTGQNIFIPEELQSLIVHAEYSKILLTVEQLKKFHKDAGNGFMLQKNENDQLPILPVFPFHGEHINETWPEYNARAIDRVKYIRAQWHRRLEAKSKWYNAYHHHQQIH